MTGNNQNTDLSELLEGTADALDISREQFEMASSRYEDLGEWLIERGVGTPEVYAQGSFRLGTVVRPEVGGQYDVDLVFWRDMNRSSTTQNELKQQAGDLLADYVDQRGAISGSPTVVEKGRCWCLEYEQDGFHMDVLPVIPDEEGSETSILLTDRDLRLWQHSNPIGYADWFWDEMGETVNVSLARRAREMQCDVEEVPRWMARTTLQRVVQLIKRHRDLYFDENPDDSPPSILITTLATRAYEAEVDLYSALLSAVTLMPAHIETRPDGLWVPNPAHHKENFADKWNSAPERKEHFDRWVMALQSEVVGWSRQRGIDSVASDLSASFGAQPVTSSTMAFGDRLRASAASGSLRVSGTGQVSGSGPHAIPNHTFFHGAK